jgi:GNAT superfamily N-acetyltransferase
MTGISYTVPGYPTEYRTRDGQAITLRPMLRSDKQALLDFFNRISAEDRLYLRGDVTSRETVTEWAETLDYRRVLPLLAFDDGTIVGDGTLHRNQDELPRHIAEVRIVIDPTYRNQGVGRNMLQHLIKIAKAEDPELEQILFEIVGDTEQAAQHAARALGFVPATVFSAHERYYRAEPHELILLALQVNEPRGDLETEDPAAYMF